MKKIGLTLFAALFAMIGFSQARKSVTTNSAPTTSVSKVDNGSANVGPTTSLDVDKINLVMKGENIVRDADDEYYGLSSHILTFLNVNVMPESFPKNENLTYKQYNKKMTGWARNNFDLIKPEYLIIK